jgi:hypothetical protein
VTAAAARGASVARRLRQTLSLGIADHPCLFYPVMRRRAAYRAVLISDRTGLVIEGFPRSGNTFAVTAVQFAQDHPLSIARHTHAPAQVMEAARRGLPTLVLVRDPRDACVSLVIRDPDISLAFALRRYDRFYSRVAPLWKSYIVASFAQVTSDFSLVVQRLNVRFNTGLAPFVHTPENCDRVFGIVEDMSRRMLGGVLKETRVARPSVVRNALKASAMRGFEDQGCRTLLDACNSRYREFLDLARE